MPTSFASGKEAVLSDDRNSSVEAFGWVVVDIQSGSLQELFELLFDIQGIRDGLGDKGGRLFRLVEYPSLLKKFPDELLRLPTCIFPLLLGYGFCTLLFRSFFCNTLNLVEGVYNFQRRLSFCISAFNTLWKAPPDMRPATGNLAVQFFIGRVRISNDCS